MDQFIVLGYSPQMYRVSHPDVWTTVELCDEDEAFFYVKVFVIYPICLSLLQVTPKAGRTSPSLETPTTWWEPTVSLCSLTTFNESSAVVMERNVEPVDKMKTLQHMKYGDHPGRDVYWSPHMKAGLLKTVTSCS